MINELKHIISGEDYQLNQHILIHNPFLGEIIELEENNYYRALQFFTSRPYDAMVFLYDIGIKHEDIDEFDFFIQKLIMFSKNMKMSNGDMDKGVLDGISLIFPEMDFSSFAMEQNPKNNEICLYNEKTGCVIDKLIYKNISIYLRKINCIPEKLQFEKIGNDAARKMIVRKMRRESEKRKNESYLSNLISALVNSNGFKYDYETIKTLHISQFWDAFMRINKIINFNQTMAGVYAGTVDYSKIIDKESLSWVSELKLNK